MHKKDIQVEDILQATEDIIQEDTEVLIEAVIINIEAHLIITEDTDAKEKTICQQPFLAIANFVVSSRSRFARIFIFNRK